MGKKQKDAASKAAEKGLSRPALIVSERTVNEYSLFLRHLILGLSDESVPVALVCRPGRGVDSLVSPTVEVVKHPVFDLPFMGPQNRKVLVERLGNYKPTVLHCLCESKAELARQVAEQLDLPYVLTVNSLLRRWGRLSISSEHCAKIITPARSIAAYLANFYPGLASRIEQINIGTFVAERSACFRSSGELVSMVTARALDKVADFEILLYHCNFNG